MPKHLFFTLMIKKLFLFWILFFTGILTSFAQYATKHHIAPAPWKYWSNANEIVIGTMTNETVNVVLRKSDGTLITNLTVNNLQPVSYRFQGQPTNQFYNIIGEIEDDIGLIVEATAPVMVNLRNIASDTGGTSPANIKGNASLVSFGNEGLGTEFLIGYYRTSTQGLFIPDNTIQGAVYSVMATENNTSVTILNENITLNQGQSYLFTAPIGTKITANKLVVMNVGSYGDTPQLCGPGGVNGQDGTFDQIAPTSVLGTKYLVVRGNGTAPNSVQANLNYGSEQTVVIATQPNTTLTISHYTATGVLINTQTQILANQGSIHTFYHGNTTSYSSSLIESTAPVVVYSGTAVECETDISTVLPIGNCSGAFNIQTKKFINYNSQNLPYMGFVIIEHQSEPVLLNNQNIETLSGNNRIPLGTSGLYLIRFTNANIGNPENIILKSNLPLTSALVQQGSGFSMSAFFSSFGALADTPTMVVNEDCSVTLSAATDFPEYQWYKDNELIATTQNHTHTINQSGNYSVRVLRPCGWSEKSLPLNITVEPCADLKITKKILNTQGTQVTFRITVENLNQYYTSNNVTVTDLLPTGYSFVSYTATVGNYNPTSGQWTIGNLAPNASATLDIKCTITSTANYLNTATVSSQTTDPQQNNNTASAGIEKPIADIDAVKTDNSDYYEKGKEIIYNITIINNGPDDVFSINVSDPVPQGLENVNWSSTQGTQGEGDLIDTIEHLPAKATVIYTVKGKVLNTHQGELTNIVSLTSDYYIDPKPECTRCKDTNYEYPRVPKGISPNEDGKNDYLDLSDFFISQISIFNRYGKEVYAKTKYKNEWKGQDNTGKQLPAGTYFYSILLIDGEVLNGYIQLAY